MAYTVTDLLRLAQVPVSLADSDPDDTSGFKGGKRAAEKALRDSAPELTELQEKMYADAYTGGRRRVLVVLQGMDTAGKGGVIDHALGLLSPNGFRLKSFKKPTEDELADEKEIERRYGAINEWEKKLVENGTVLIKCMLHTSYDKQRERLLARLDDPDKQWKFKPDDIDERERWADYQTAYELALERCNTDAAPWYVVPSDRKWYRNWAVGQMLLEALRGMRLEWPEPGYDVDEQRKRLESEADGDGAES